MKNAPSDFINAVWQICLKHTSRNPLAVLHDLMALPACRLHGPEHHTLVGSALLTAYKNSGGEVDLPRALEELHARAQNVPGGVCGYWGACGAAISSGMFLSVVLHSAPLGGHEWGLCNQMTASSLQAIGGIDGPRCCKRNSTLAILQAVRFAKEQLGIEMEFTAPVCTYCHQNAQCISARCPFHP